MAKEFGGQPWWVWAAGGVALVGGYLWIRHSQNAAAAAAAPAGQPLFVGQPTGMSADQLALWLADHQSSAAPAPSSGGDSSAVPVQGQHAYKFSKISLAQALKLFSAKGQVYEKRSGRFYKVTGTPNANESLYTTSYEKSHHPKIFK